MNAKYEWNLPVPGPVPVTVTMEFPCKWCGETLRVTKGLSGAHSCSVYHSTNEHFAYVMEQITACGERPNG